MTHEPLNDNECGWYNNIVHSDKVNRLTQKVSADFAVIGSGFIGLASARQLALLHPNANIALIDAERTGFGASGRNSGFVIDLPHKFALSHPDITFKKKIINLNRAAISRLDTLIKSNNIDCQWSAAGKYQGAVGNRGEEFLDAFTPLLDELDEPYELLDRTALKKILGTTHYSHAVYTPGTHLVQPAALAQGLAQHLPENITLFESSPIKKINRNAGKWHLTGNKGEIIAEKVIMACNIFMREWGYLKHRMVPISTFASMTRTLTKEEIKHYGGQIDWGLTPADHAGTTIRMTQDYRFIVRNSYKYTPNYGADISLENRQKIAASHKEALIKRYPMLGNISFTHTWGGTYAIASNFVNFFGKIDNNMYAAACDNGVGIAWGTIAGEMLANLASGNDSQLLSDIQTVSGTPKLNPPDPLLGIGVSTKIKLAQWKSRGEI